MIKATMKVLPELWHESHKNICKGLYKEMKRIAKLGYEIEKITLEADKPITFKLYKRPVY